MPDWQAEVVEARSTGEVFWRRCLAPGGSFVISLGAVVSERDNLQDLIFDL